MLLPHALRALSKQQTLSLSFVANTTANTTTISLPTGSAAGDLAVFVDTAIHTQATVGLPALVVPSGFTSFISESALRSDSSSGSGGRMVFSWKVLTAADISAGQITGMDGNSARRKYLASIRPSRPIVSVDTSEKHSQATAGTALTSPITLDPASSDGKFFIAAIYAQNNSSITTSPVLTNLAVNFSFDLAYGVSNQSIATTISQTGTFRSFGAVHMGVS